MPLIGSVNREFPAEKFDALWDRVKAHVAKNEQWIQHLHVGEHSDHYLPVKVITGTAWQDYLGATCLFARRITTRQIKPSGRF